MKILVFAAALTAAPLTMCVAQPTTGVIVDLARAWSGNETPVCEQESTGGKESYGQTDPWKCQWVRDDVQRVHGHLDDAPSLSAVLWERTMRDTVDLDRFTDSLATALLTQGMTHHKCGQGPVEIGWTSASYWRRPGLVVHLTEIVPEADPPRIVILALDDPARLPDFVSCESTVP